MIINMVLIKKMVNLIFKPEKWIFDEKFLGDEIITIR